MKNFCIKPTATAGVAFAVLSASHLAIADTPSERPLSERPLADRSIATQLFKEGRALLDQGRVAPACRKLEESQRLGPGGGTLLNLALCHEKEGRTATAWVEFTEALGIARRDDRQARVEFARTHIAQLEPLLSRLSLQVPPAADLPDLEIRRDGSVVGRAAWGSPIPVDPGDHLIEAAAPAKVRWKQSVVVGANAESKVLVIPVLDDAPVQENAESAPLAPPTTIATGTEPEVRGPAPAVERRDRPVESSSSTTVPAWIFMGLGVAGAGAGAYFGALAVSQKRDADRNCPNDACSAEGARQNSDAIRNANYATIGFGVGLAGLGLGAVLLATHTAASSPATTTRARSHEGALELEGGGLSLDPTGRTGAKLTLSGRW